MPIKDRGKFLNYQREYNKKRKQGGRNLHPDSEISSPQAAYRGLEQQGVTTSHTSQIAGCKPSAGKTSSTPINKIKNNMHLRARGKKPRAATVNHVNTASIPGSAAVIKLDFSQLRIKGPIQTVGAVDRFRALDEIAEAVRTGDPISGEELARLRRVGAKI